MIFYICFLYTLSDIFNAKCLFLDGLNITSVDEINLNNLFVCSLSPIEYNGFTDNCLNSSCDILYLHRCSNKLRPPKIILYDLDCNFYILLLSLLILLLV